MRDITIKQSIKLLKNFKLSKNYEKKNYRKMTRFRKNTFGVKRLIWATLENLAVFSEISADKCK